MEGVLEAVGLAGGAQRILHQRTAAGAELEQGEARGLSHLLPEIDEEEADELAENLADLGRRDEIASRADGAAGGIVAVTRMAEAEPHVGRDRHRSGFADLRIDLFRKAEGLLSHGDAPLRK